VSGTAHVDLVFIPCEHTLGCAERQTAFTWNGAKGHVRQRLRPQPEFSTCQPCAQRPEGGLCSRHRRLRAQGVPKDIRVYPRAIDDGAMRIALRAEYLLAELRLMLQDGILSRDELLSAVLPDLRGQTEVVNCPVCGGAGRVPNTFYGPTKNNSVLIICQSCHGAGLVWKGVPA
jgi:hypothetical protein